MIIFFFKFIEMINTTKALLKQTTKFTPAKFLKMFRPRHIILSLDNSKTRVQTV